MSTIQVASVIIAIITLIIIYYTLKPGDSSDKCNANQHYRCPDDWTQIPTDTPAPYLLCNTSGKYEPGVGPAGCQVTCPTGTSPCWNTKNNNGTCLANDIPCECSADSDCQHDGKCDPVTRLCDCTAAYTGAQCQDAIAGCNPSTCGKLGQCKGDQCVPNNEGVRVAPYPSTLLQCNNCLPGRGPVNDCTLELRHNMYIPWQPFSNGCWDQSHDASFYLDQSKLVFPGANSYSDSTYYCSVMSGTKINPCVGKYSNSNLYYSGLPDGYWADPKTTPSPYGGYANTYTPCNIDGKNNTVLYPNGYQMPVTPGSIPPTNS